MSTINSKENIKTQFDIISFDLINRIFSFNFIIKEKIIYKKKNLDEYKIKMIEHFNIITSLSKKFIVFNSNYINKLKESIIKLKRILYFIKKYNTYQESYEYNLKPSFYNINNIQKYNLDSPPILYDAIISGCSYPFCKSSEKNVNMEDIREIIKICPESVHYNMGIARCRSYLSPLWAARLSDNIFREKKEIIELLLKNGAKFTDMMGFNGILTTIESDLI